MPLLASEEFGRAVFRGDAQARDRSHYLIRGHALEHEMERKEDREGERHQQNTGHRGSTGLARAVLNQTIRLR
jgi:hypothetical protein